MIDKRKFYINGSWVEPVVANDHHVTNPSTEDVAAVISMGARADVDRAVESAKAAFESWRWVSKKERLELLGKLLAAYEKKYDEIAQAISAEMGAPITLAKNSQAKTGLGHIKSFIAELEAFDFEHSLRADNVNDHIVYQPIGVCGLITPWNWPINQLALKVIPALAVGCCVVLKPSELSPLSAMLLAEAIDEAGYPAGVFNLVNGDGPIVGEAMSQHPDIQMISITGSVRAGVAVSKSAADNVKRVTLELGGKGANLIFADADVEDAVRRGAKDCFNNTGQTCRAPTRMLVERSVYDHAVDIAIEVARSTQVGFSNQEGPHIGPLVSQAQFDRVQALIQSGIDEGAKLIAGGLGKPEGFERGYFVRPTVFSDVESKMRISQEEIFGPVLSIIPFDDEDHAVEIANDTQLGLMNYVQTGSVERAKRVALKLQSGMVVINGAPRGAGSPFGGVRQSGNGREGGRWGLEEFLEVKAIHGWS